MSVRSPVTSSICAMSWEESSLKIDCRLHREVLSPAPLSGIFWSPAGARLGGRVGKERIREPAEGSICEGACWQDLEDAVHTHFRHRPVHARGDC